MSDVDSKLTAAERRLAAYGRDALAHAKANGRIDRLVEAAIAGALPAPPEPPPQPPAPKSALGTMRAASVGTAAAAIAAVVAFGWVGTHERAVEPPLAPAPASTTAGAHAAPHSNDVARAEPASAPSGVAVTSLPDAVDAKHAPVSAKATAPSTSRGDDVQRLAIGPAPDAREDPAALFERANTARRRADYGDAEKLYRSLVQTHPDTREAETSRIILGRMLLARGAAVDALSSFDAYLAEAPQGSLREQALIGRAQSLQALGRRKDERAAWRALLEAFPATASRATALERGGAVP